MTKRLPTTDPRLAVAYLRISTDAEKQAHGLDVQRRAIEAWAVAQGLEVRAWHQDERSGTEPLERRLGLAAALAELRQLGAGLLVVHRIDRFARDAAEGAAIERAILGAGARLAVVEGGSQGDDPASVFLRRVTLAAAEFEGALIRARIRAAKASCRARGLYGGGEPPYGWRRGEGAALEVCPEEQAILGQLRALAARGGSVRRVAQLAAKAGLKNRRGNPWGPSQIHLVLKRPAG